MKNLFLLLLLLVVSPAFAQTNEEEAVKRVLQHETDSYHAGNYNQWATDWAHEPYVLWIINQPDGGYRKMVGWDDLSKQMKDMIAENGGNAGSRPTVQRENYVIRQNGSMAFVTFDQFEVRANGRSPRFRESRVLEKKGQDWKLIHSNVFLPWSELMAPSKESVTAGTTNNSDLPKLTDAQKVQFLAAHSTVTDAINIAYAKSIGKNPKEYGRDFGKLIGPSWKQTTAQGKELESIVEHLNAMAQGFGTSFELVNRSATEAVVKRGMLLQAPQMAGLFTSLGVTAQDMEAWNEGVMGEIATGLGLSLSQRQDGQNMIVTLKKL
ncbi:hypothetical protein [Spirosoma arcticum]